MTVELQGSGGGGSTWNGTPRTGATSSHSGSSGRTTRMAIQQRTADEDYNTALNLLQAAQQAQIGGGGSGYGGGGGGYGGGGYGGGGGAGSGIDIAKMTAELTGQRDAARAALPGYLSAYNTGIAESGAQNATQAAGYNNQITALMQRLQREGLAQQASLQRDVGAQGGSLGPLQAAAGQNAYAASSIGSAQAMYNARLAQLMGAATSDHRAAGQAVNLASQANLDESYMQALLALQARG